MTSMLASARAAYRLAARHGANCTRASVTRQFTLQRLSTAAEAAVDPIGSDNNDAASQLDASRAEKQSRAALKRFWKDVSLRELPTGGFELCLDGKSMRTPSQNTLVVPPGRELVAYGVASEWEGQDKIVKKHDLPLTSLVVRAIDDFSKEEYRSLVLDSLLKYLHTDSVCYFQDYPESFAEAQDRYWRSLISWVKDNCGQDIKSTDSILSVAQEESVVEYFRSEIEKLDPLALAAFEKGVMSTKSFLIPFVLLKNPEYSVEDAAHAARLEQLHQIERWGEVEDSHDVERERLQRDLAVIRAAWLA